MGFQEKNAEVDESLKCSNCGAPLVFKPGTDVLICPYCGTENKIKDAPIDEDKSYDYNEFIKDNNYQRELTVFVAKCKSCGASTTLDQYANAADCPFCGSPLVIEDKTESKMLQPHFVLPFQLDKKKAFELYQKWISKLWFAPDKLIKNVNSVHNDKIEGIYLPYWSFDMDTYTEYSGSRGDYYWVEERYYEEVDGRREERTREVRKTRWFPVSGSVDCSFDDVLIGASNHLQDKIEIKLEPWNLNMLKAYRSEYLSGFRSEIYQMEPPTALENAKMRVDGAIREAICNDIGGDEQQIGNYENEYHDIGIKYDLLPIWITAFHFEGKVYQIVINGSTGEVIGQRPYSISKILFAIIIGLAVILLIYYFTKK